ncbi:MAG TPA: hypothetical protein VJY41_05430 [Prolixibacteraceae bacterium]|nr:hypothetical protein [Prolixibacteraceae bacterium]
MAKKKQQKSKKSSALLIGIVIGIIVSIGAIYCYQHYYKNSDLEKKANKIERQTKKEINKAEKKAKKLFD